MPRIIDRPVTVAADLARGCPRSFCWRCREYRIARVQDVWKETGRWWAGENEKVFYRVETETGGVYELYTDQERWYLYKIYD